ncbi:hypothetical protein LR48_Vigan04g123000 [Vigna angularis]|uniref:Transposase (putative) gypsy type domain-containing protein n=1 Tax=Phaseolus angularis TaxID=3914 RepID=A0A0L9UER9_PHAAN|nr:hypothetical protein LR48_Vigan04g123000 [Vigna angularis]
MAAVHIESSSESSGGVRGSSARGDDGHIASPSSVSSSFLEETVGSSGREPASPDAAGSRIIHGIPIFLRRGSIRIDGSPYEPYGDGTLVTKYDWAPYNANLFASTYGTCELLEWRVNRTHVVRDVEDSRLVRAGVSLRNERVYYGKRSSPDDFFYMYANVFAQLFVRVPFTEFQMAVLWEANVALAQLHPNFCAAVQAFLAMCLAVGVTPTVPIFFHYFEIRLPPQGGWVSLTSVRDRTLFRPFSDSFKNFKHHYFKVIIDVAGRHEFHDFAGNPLFPFYWTREPQKIKAFPVRVLGPADLEAVCIINALSHLMTAPTPRQSNFMASKKRAGASSLSSRAKWSPNVPHPPLVRRGPVPASRAPGADPLPSLVAVFVDPSSEAATASAAPLVRKRKDPAGEGHKDKEASSSRSASKKARKGKEKIPSAPLPGGIFSPAFNMSDQTKFHMSSSQRALIEPLSEAELTNASAMEQLILAHDDYDKRIEQLEADLEKAKKESADAKDRLAIARGDHERLLEECSQLKTKVTRQRSSKVGLLKSNQVLTDDLARAREKISELEAGIVFEHEKGFNKALHQAFVLAGIHEPFALGFDIEKDVFDGVLVDLNSIVDDEGPKTEGPSGAAVADEAVEVEDEDEGADDDDN